MLDSAAVVSIRIFREATLPGNEPDHGRVATNFFTVHGIVRVVQRRSRGELVTGFLDADLPPIDYLAAIDGSRYDGFNLLAWADGELAYLSNQGDAPRRLAPGVYGLANARLDSACDKVRRSKRQLRRLLDDRTVDDAALLGLLADRRTGPASEVDATRLPSEIARAASAPFIVMPEFGTRCSTLVTVNGAGEWHFLERRFDADGIGTGETVASFGAAEDA